MRLDQRRRHQPPGQVDGPALRLYLASTVVSTAWSTPRSVSVSWPAIRALRRIRSIIGPSSRSAARAASMASTGAGQHRRAGAPSSASSAHEVSVDDVSAHRLVWPHDPRTAPSPGSADVPPQSPAARPQLLGWTLLALLLAVSMLTALVVLYLMAAGSAAATGGCGGG